MDVTSLPSPGLCLSSNMNLCNPTQSAQGFLNHREMVRIGGKQVHVEFYTFATSKPNVLKEISMKYVARFKCSHMVLNFFIIMRTIYRAIVGLVLIIHILCSLSLAPVRQVCGRAYVLVEPSSECTDME